MPSLLPAKQTTIEQSGATHSGSFTSLKLNNTRCNPRAYPSAWVGTRDIRLTWSSELLEQTCNSKLTVKQTREATSLSISSGTCVASEKQRYTVQCRRSKDNSEYLCPGSSMWMTGSMETGQVLHTRFTETQGRSISRCKSMTKALIGKPFQKW